MEFRCIMVISKSQRRYGIMQDFVEILSLLALEIPEQIEIAAISTELINLRIITKITEQVLMKMVTEHT